MKSPANPDLELIREEERLIGEKTKALEDELGGKVKEQEARKAAAEKKAAQLRAELEAMKTDYNKAWAQVEAGERKILEDKALLLRDVEVGKASMAEYLSKGSDAAQIAVQARASADVKMRELADVVRAKAKAVLEAELEIATAEYELTYLMSAPGIFLIESYRDFIKRAEARVSAIRGGWPSARARLDEAKARVNRSALEALSEPRTWPDLDEKGLRELRLDPEIPDEWMADLDAAIASIAGTAERVDVVGRHRLGRNRGLDIIGRRMPKDDKTHIYSEAEIVR